MNRNKRNILMDATGIVSTPTGLGKYSYFLIKALVTDDRYNYHILHQANLPVNHALFSLKSPLVDFTPVDSPVIGLRREFKMYSLKRFINSFNVFHCLSSYLPGFGLEIPSIVTVHDLKYLLYPRFFENRFKSFYYKLIIRHSIKRADRIIAVSEATKRDIVNMDIPADKVTVVHEAPTIMQPSSNASLPETIRGKKYLLYVGEQRPHKNIPRITQAFEIISKKLGNGCPYLVFAGAKFDDHREKYRSTKLIFLGPVDEPLLVPLYKNALTLVYPSLYEGFGLPIIEAMALGTPVITSNCSSMPEVAGEAAILIDPRNVGQIADAMLKVIKDDSERKRLSKLGLQRSARFSWEDAARLVLALYARILSQH